MRQQGTCACWKGGYGFLLPLNGGGKGKIFVHQSDIETKGYRQLYPGDLVEFESADGERGIHAVRVRLIQSTAPAEPAA
jgi:cold shock protein